MNRCKRGHLRNAQNTRQYKRAGNPKTYTQCRLCSSYLQRMRYRNDPAYRAQEQTRNRNRSRTT